MNRVEVVCILAVFWIGLSQSHLQNHRRFHDDDDEYEGRSHQQQRLQHRQTLEQRLRAKSRNYLEPPRRYQEEDEDESFDSNEPDEDERYNPWEDSFYDRYEDGTYAYGYSLPNGGRRFERSFYDDNDQLVVEGLYTEARNFGNGLVYELHCYRSGVFGYRPRAVRYLRRPPNVRRGAEPNVDCFDN